MKITKWIKNKLIQPVKAFFKNIAEDRKNYDKLNENENKVFNSHYFSCYRGVPVLKTAFKASFSFGFIGLSKRQQNSDTLKHEYGHKLQLKSMGVFRYFFRVACPSLTINLLHRMKKLPYEYHSYPWEKEADTLGEVLNRKYKKEPIKDKRDASFRELVKLFFKKKKRN